MKRALLLAGLGLLLAACGGSGGGSDGTNGVGAGFQASCLASGGAVCQEWRGIDSFQVQQVQGNCAATSGTYSAGACPEQNRSGRCVATTGAMSVTYAYYDVPPNGISTLRNACSGEWIDG